MRRLSGLRCLSKQFLPASIPRNFMTISPKALHEVKFHERKESTPLPIKQPPPDGSTFQAETPRTSLLMELTDRVGVLHDVLRYFWKYDVNVSRIESRPVKDSATGVKRFDFFVDFDGRSEDENIEKLLASLRPMTDKLLILDEKEVRSTCISCC
jgi:ACT domain